MNMMPATAAAEAATPLPVVASSATAILAAAELLLPHLEQGRRIDAAVLRTAMEDAFGASDATGAWDWKTAYEACEAATVLFLRKFGRTLLRKAGSPTAALPMLEKIAALMPTHTRRSAESQAFQQFSTPVPLGLAVTAAASITSADRVLEPSAGTGLLAILAEIAGGTLVLNELAETRADILSSLFPALTVTRFDAAQIDDHLDPASVPTVVVMNPPFSAMANVEGRMHDAAFRHVASALARLAPGGRLVAITGANFAPDAPEWSAAFARLPERGRVVFSAAIDGRVYAKHGTTYPTRLTVIDKVPTDDPAVFLKAPGIAPDVATLMVWIAAHVPERRPVDPAVAVTVAAPRTVRGYIARTARSAPRAAAAEPQAISLPYEPVEWTPPEGAHLTDAIYEDYALQSIRIPDAQDHPTQLVQSAAMASVAPPTPSYRPSVPANVHHLLSGAQLETLILAGEAHSDHLAGAWSVDETLDIVAAVTDATLHIVAGLLLPIWKRLPHESSRVYRLQTDDGERIIGRRVSPAWAANAVTTGSLSLTGEDALAALVDGRTVIDLAEGLQLRRVRVMGGYRIELTGFTDTMRERLTAYGLFHEIISWKLRMFVPTDAKGAEVLARLLDRWPVERVSEREAA